MRASVTAFAPAKINLALHVGPPQADGRHPLTSLVAFASVGDRVTLEEGAGFSLSGPFASALAGEPDNLVTRALARVVEGRPVRVRLEKMLPVASGIGGGSADAAAALRAARTFFALDLDDAALEAQAAALGSDVPACVRARPAIMTGTGEALQPFALAPLHAVLVNPGVALSTAAVYRRFDQRGVFGALSLDPNDLPGSRNDLEAAACDLAPEVGAVLEALRASPEARLARMSGSGATCFALVGDAASARRLAEAIGATHSGWWVRSTVLGVGPVDGPPGGA
jgi:4-diphosphocytidyl-2-C-methyl-D-erythritol kinase